MEYENDKSAEIKKEQKKTKKSPRDEHKKSPIKQFFDNLSAEFRKIVWPSKDDLIKQTVVVIIISLFMGAVIFGMDALFNLLQTLVTGLVS